MQRSVSDLSKGIAEKFQLDVSTITRVVRVNPKGLKIAFDEDVIRELPEGQDMVAEFVDTSRDTQIKTEGQFQNPASTQIELRLVF